MTELNYLNVCITLRNLADFLYLQNDNDRKMYIDDINGLLENIANNDGFGTEGQCDPRGDQRNEKERK